MAGLKAMNTAAVEPAEGALAAAHRVGVIVAF